MFPCSPVKDDTFTMRPYPAARMGTIAARVMLNVPVRWTPMTACQCSSLIFHTTVSRVMPALLMTTSSAPVQFNVAS
jgi:hypothetical protein